MSTHVASKTLTVPARGMEAVTRAAEALGVDDAKLLATVLLEAATEELSRSGRFADRVRVTYDALIAVKPNRGSSRRQEPPAKLTPIKRIEGREIDLGASPDPYFLLELYGKEQLPAALARYPVKALLESVEIVQQHFPGTKPKGKTKAVVIDYIVEHVAGPGY
jgi:hypothetical protein